MSARFCSRCGAALPGRPPVACAACGAEHWANAKPCACGVVVRDGRVLLVRRAHEPWLGLWAAPGGFCDAGEHPVATMEREVYEETGVPVRAIGFLGIWTDLYANGPDAPGAEDADTISVAYYHAEPIGDQARPPDAAEVAEARWFLWDAVPAELAPPGTLRAVLDASRAAHSAGNVVTPLPDRPRD